MSRTPNDQWAALMADRLARVAVGPGPFTLRAEGSSCSKNLRILRNQAELRLEVAGPRGFRVRLEVWADDNGLAHCEVRTLNDQVRTPESHTRPRTKRATLTPEEKTP